MSGRPERAGRAILRAVEWFLTGVLIASSAGILALTGYLVYRLFSLDR